jgi:photosystem II cytochrome c550
MVMFTLSIDQIQILRRTMLKRFLLAAVAALFLVIQFNIGSVNAVELDENIRTVPLNDKGETMTLSLKQVKQGQKIFVDSCSYCHKGGATKTNPNVNLGLTALSGAYPARDNVA